MDNIEPRKTISDCVFDMAAMFTGIALEDYYQKGVINKEQYISKKELLNNIKNNYYAKRKDDEQEES